jgi:hypothetical protein
MAFAKRDLPKNNYSAPKCQTLPWNIILMNSLGVPSLLRLESSNLSANAFGEF